MRHHLLRDMDLPHHRTIAEIDAVMEDVLDRRLQELAEQAAEYDCPRLLTGHFSVSGAEFGSERSVMLGRDVTVLLSALDNPVWDYVALGHIHQHQCLPVMHTGPAIPPTLPAAVIDHPGGGQLDPAVRLGVVGHVCKTRLQPVQGFRFDYRILEKTARVAQLGGIGQLGPPDGDDGLP